MIRYFPSVTNSINHFNISYKYLGIIQLKKKILKIPSILHPICAVKFFANRSFNGFGQIFPTKGSWVQKLRAAEPEMFPMKMRFLHNNLEKIPIFSRCYLPADFPSTPTYSSTKWYGQFTLNRFFSIARQSRKSGESTTFIAGHHDAIDQRQQWWRVRLSC